MALKNCPKLEPSPSSSRYTIMTADEFRKWLMKFDHDGDGRINKDELRAVIQRSGRRFSSWKSSRAVRNADDDGDGYIDEDEIKNMVEFAKKTFGIKIVPY